MINSCILALQDFLLHRTEVAIRHSISDIKSLNSERDPKLSCCTLFSCRKLFIEGKLNEAGIERKDIKRRNKVKESAESFLWRHRWQTLKPDSWQNRHSYFFNLTAFGFFFLSLSHSLSLPFPFFIFSLFQLFSLSPFLIFSFICSLPF